MNINIKFLLLNFIILPTLCWTNTCNAAGGSVDDVSGAEIIDPDDPDIPVAYGDLFDTWFDRIGLRSLCPSGQYVYKCGDYRVGFDWLKGMRYKTEQTVDSTEVESNITTESNCIVNRSSHCAFDETTGECITNMVEDGRVTTITSFARKWECNDSNTCQCIKTTTTTKSYKTYNYYYTDNPDDLLQQMRDFFNFTTQSDIPYCQNWDDEQNKCTNAVSISKTEAKTDLRIILNKICSKSVTCMPCPNSANVGASELTLNALTKRVESGTFHTIADCYTNIFEDSTGTYQYFDGATPQLCYYGNTDVDLQGDDISGFLSDTE